MTNKNILKDINNSTTTNEDTEMTNKLFKLYCKSIEDSSGVELKYYKDTLLRIQKVGENLIIGVYFHPVENEDWKQMFISTFSGPIPEVILSDPENEEEEEIIKKEIKLLTEKMNKVCYELQPRSDIFHKSLEEIEKDYGGIENVEIIVKLNEVCNYITESDVELWRINKMDEEYFNSIDYDYEKQDLYSMAGFYKDAELKIKEDENGKIKAVISFTPEEEAEDWKHEYIQDFARIEEGLAEKALTSEKEADIFAEIINEEYNEYCDPTVKFYASVDEIKQKLSGKNVEVIVEDTDGVFVELISSQDVQDWREGVLQDRDEDY